jgi:hypothetical protein
MSDEVYEVRYPFVRDVYQEMDSDESGFGYVDVPSWKPGVRMEARGREGEYTDSIADGVGKMRLTVVSRHTPSLKYRERVFYTRQWIDPDGRSFGKRGLRMCGAAAFKRMCSGYRYPFEMLKPQEAKAS